MEELTVGEVTLIHDMVIRHNGGALGLRDKAALEGSLGRAAARLAYGEGDIIGAAVAVASGIVSAHPFVDGNKRTALVALRVLLKLNGIDFELIEPEAADMTCALAAHLISESDFESWVRRATRPV